MRMNARLLFAAAVVSLATLAGCPGGAKVPGGGGLPGGDKIPGGGVPGGLGGESGMVDPNTCGNYAAMEGGARLKAFLTAVQDLAVATEDTVKVVKQSCVMLGQELGMPEPDLQGEAKEVCAKVWGVIDENMKVSFKAKAALKVTYKPAVCRVNVEASAKVAAECEASASANVTAKCSGVCRGKCDGQCAGKAGTGGAAGECGGECKGTCKGQCEGHADVNASAQCKAQASVKAQASMECTEPELKIDLDAKLVLDRSKAEMTVKALKNGLPKLLSIKARMAPVKYAAEAVLASAKELKDMGPKFVNSFKDQALCIGGQLTAAVNAATKIEANVSVSVSVSAQASGSIGS
jgi:modification target Cys-rich repeat protein